MRTKKLFLTIPSLALAVALTACAGKSKHGRNVDTAAPADLSITTLFSPIRPSEGMKRSRSSSKTQTEIR